MLSTMPENDHDCERTKLVIHQVCSALLQAKIIKPVKNENHVIHEVFDVRFPYKKKKIVRKILKFLFIFYF